MEPNEKTECMSEKSLNEVTGVLLRAVGELVSTTALMLKNLSINVHVPIPVKRRARHFVASSDRGDPNFSV